MRQKFAPLLLLALLTGLLSCKKEHSQTYAVTPPPDTTVAPSPIINVLVNQKKSSFVIPATFEGLSFETQILLTNPNFLNANNGVLLKMIKNLGPGILRIGGGTSDEISWSENGKTGPGIIDSLTKSDIDRLAAFSKATGWKVLFGLNLGNDDTSAAVNEAYYVKNALGDNLYALQSGNEPDAFIYGIKPSSYVYSDFQDEWEAYFSAIKNKLPNVQFAGPDVAFNSEWETAFAENEHDKIRLLDEHFYVAGPATDSWINYQTILTDTSYLSGYLHLIKKHSTDYHIPYRISETNNIWGGGKHGTSDVFAAALWALDAMWTVAENNGTGINFHDGIGLYYSPVVIDNNDVPEASPEYYAMLAFKYGAVGGTVIPVSIDSSPFCSAYACSTPDGKYHITLVNRSENSAYSFRINLTDPASSASIIRLTAPGVTAASGTMFGGATVAADGSFQIKKTENTPVQGKSFTVSLPACSAAVVSVQ